MLFNFFFFLNKNKPRQSMYHAKLVNVSKMLKTYERSDPKIANFYHEMYASPKTLAPRDIFL